MIRHKPSEKVPKDGQIHVVVKTTDSRQWERARYFKNFDQWEIITYSNSVFLDSSKIDWWMDPMEEG